jgi:hypothetical protein
MRKLPHTRNGMANQSVNSMSGSAYLPDTPPLKPAMSITTPFTIINHLLIVAPLTRSTQIP